jgi:acetoin:2,6-dichlorophenolindophenol oxidoreductase subunit alpha
MDTEEALGLYRTMTRLRQFEKRAHDLFLQNLVKGTTHLGTGQEAIAAGVAAAMRPATTPSSPTAATTTCSPAARR